MKRGIITIAVVLILIIVVFAPNINAYVKKPSFQSEYVEMEVEFCGLGEKRKIKLSQAEYEEFNLLFKNTLKRLKEVKSDEEAIFIFNKAIEDFDKYGLLGGISVKSAQSLITERYQKINENKFLQRFFDFEFPKEHYNYLCLIAGQSNNTHFFMLPVALLIYLNYISNDKLLSPFTTLFYFYMITFGISAKYRFLTFITFGRYYEYMDNWYHESSFGNMWTRGLAGDHSWNCSFIGDFLFKIPLGVPRSNNYYIGVQGFFGLQATVEGVTTLLGISPRVKFALD